MKVELKRFASVPTERRERKELRNLQTDLSIRTVLPLTEAGMTEEEGGSRQNWELSFGHVKRSSLSKFLVEMLTR